MLSLSTKGDPNWLRKVNADLRKDYRNAAVRALNRTADSVRSAAVKQIATDLGGVKQKAVRDATKVRRAAKYRLESAVVATGKRLPLIDFGARQTKKGVTYRMRQARKLLAGAFINVMRSGHRGVFKRRGKSRLPIDERRGPSIPKVFVNERIQTALKALALDRLQKEWDHQLGFYLSKRASGSTFRSAA